MIPAGRTAIGLPGVAEVLRMPLGTLYNTKPHRRPDFPQPLNPHTARGQLWDDAQVRAYAAGQPVPALPTEPQPGDLLDDTEAADHAGIALATWLDYAAKGRLEANSRTVHGTRHWIRSTIRRRHTQPPGSRGRPAGVQDTQPRSRRPVVDPRKDQLAELIAASGPLPPVRELAERFHTSRRTMERWLHDLRTRSPHHDAAERHTL